MKEILKELEEKPLKKYDEMTETEKIDTCTKTIIEHKDKFKDIINNMLSGKELSELSLKELETIVETIKITKKKGT